MFDLKNMNSVSIINVCCITLGISMSICYGSRGNETKYNNCITWRDNQSTVILTCKVANFYLPVTFYHNDSNTRVVCEINGKNKHCLPGGNRIHINKYDHTVKIELYEQKIGKNLDGRWHCIQGGRSQTTNVSVSKGIIIDSWIQLRGKTIFKNGTKYIDLECSSCRKPQGLYAEYLVNNVTAGSIRLDEEGNCVYKNANCSIDKCNCSSTADMFTFRLKVKDLHNETNFSCDMQFTDLLRKGRFSMTASKIYTGEDFSVTEYETVILKPNVAFIDENIEKTTNSTIVLDDHHLKIVLPVVIFIIGILTTATLIVYRHKRIKKKEKVNANDKSEHEEGELKPLLKDNTCKHCPKSVEVTTMCFDCRQTFCFDCHKIIHTANEELKQHTCFESNTTPESFSLSVFSCSIKDHNSSSLEYFCNNHKTFICKKCSKMIEHESCAIDIDPNITRDMVNKETEGYRSDLDSWKYQLSVCNNLCISSEATLARQLSQVKQSIDSTSKDRFSIKHGNKPADNDFSKTDIKEMLDQSMNKFKEETKNFKTENDNILDRIEEQEKVLDFVSTYGKEHHQLLILNVLKKESEMQRKRKSCEIKYRPLKMRYDNEENVVMITEEEKQLIRSITTMDASTSVTATLTQSTRNSNIEIPNDSVKTCNKEEDASLTSDLLNPSPTVYSETNQTRGRFSVSAVSHKQDENDLKIPKVRSTDNVLDKI